MPRAKNVPGDKKSSKEEMDSILSFRCVNRILREDGIEAEFLLMLKADKKPDKEKLKSDALDALPTNDKPKRKVFLKPPGPEDFRRVGIGSGSHFLKLTNPKSESTQSVLRFSRSSSNALPFYAPSLNAADISCAKIVYRPLEILGREPRSVVDHIREPDEISDLVLRAFASVFGKDCLNALRSAIVHDLEQVTSLPESGDFPIIFLPRPNGGDIQATPVSPVETFMGFKDMAAGWFKKQEKGALLVPRGRWTRQLISANLQNISGMIGGHRQRFLAQMPPVMRDYEAAILLYINSSVFPMFNKQSNELQEAVLYYASRLDMEYNNKDIRAITDRCADRLIHDVIEFINEVQHDAREIIENSNSKKILSDPPDPSTLIFKRRWKNDDDKDRAIKALTSDHFRERERFAIQKKAGVI
jgi:hypothetical protein